MPAIGLVVDASPSMDGTIHSEWYKPKTGEPSRYDIAIEVAGKLVDRKYLNSSEFEFTMPTATVFALQAKEIMSPGLDLITPGGMVLYNTDTEIRGGRYVFSHTGEPTKNVILDLNMDSNKGWRNRQLGNREVFEDCLNPNEETYKEFMGFGDFVMQRLNQRHQLGFDTNIRAGLEKSFPIAKYLIDERGEMILNVIPEGGNQVVPYRVFPVPIVITDGEISGDKYKTQMASMLDCGDNNYLLPPGIAIFVGPNAKKEQYQSFWSCTLTDVLDTEATIAKCQSALQEIIHHVKRVLTLENKSSTSFIEVTLYGTIPGMDPVQWNVIVPPNSKVFVPWTVEGGVTSVSNIPTPVSLYGIPASGGAPPTYAPSMNRNHTYMRHARRVAPPRDTSVTTDVFGLPTSAPPMRMPNGRGYMRTAARK